MLTPKGFSDLPTVTPTMVEDLTPQHLNEWIAAYQRECVAVAALTENWAEFVRLSESTERLLLERRTRCLAVEMVAEAHAILQGVDS